MNTFRADGYAIVMLTQRKVRTISVVGLGTVSCMPWCCPDPSSGPRLHFLSCGEHWWPTVLAGPLFRNCLRWREAPSPTAMPLRASSHPATRLAPAGARRLGYPASAWDNSEWSSPVRAPMGSARALGTMASQFSPSFVCPWSFAPLRSCS